MVRHPVFPLDRRRDGARPGRGRPAGAALCLRPQGQREDGAQLPARHAHLQRRRTHEREPTNYSKIFRDNFIKSDKKKIHKKGDLFELLLKFEESLFMNLFIGVKV